jgi:hypothetical protein
VTEPEVRSVRLEEHPSAGGGRLGRHVRHDERSRAFAVRPVSLGTLRSVRHKRHAAVFDQGHEWDRVTRKYVDLGSCVPNAGNGALSTAPFRHSYSGGRCVVDYRLVTAADPFEGQWPPDDTGSDGLSFAKLARSQGRIARYEHAFSLDATLTALASHPVMLGIAWRTGCDRPNASGLVRWTGDVRGGHEVVADELDVERRLVGCTNSWSAAWGLRGRFYMPWDDLGAALADDGDSTVLIQA